MWQLLLAFLIVVTYSGQKVSAGPLKKTCASDEGKVFHENLKEHLPKWCETCKGVDCSLEAFLNAHPLPQRDYACSRPTERHSCNPCNEKFQFSYGCACKPEFVELTPLFQMSCAHHPKFTCSLGWDVDKAAMNEVISEALKQGDGRECERRLGPHGQLRCFLALVQKTGDESLCNKMHKLFDTYKDTKAISMPDANEFDARCRFLAASAKKKDITLCEQIDAKTDSLKEVLRRCMLSFKEDDCDQLKSSDLRQYCHQLMQQSRPTSRNGVSSQPRSPETTGTGLTPPPVELVNQLQSSDHHVASEARTKLIRIEATATLTRKLVELSRHRNKNTRLEALWVILDGKHCPYLTTADFAPLYATYKEVMALTENSHTFNLRLFRNPLSYLVRGQNQVNALLADLNSRHPASQLAAAQILGTLHYFPATTRMIQLLEKATYNQKKDLVDALYSMTGHYISPELVHKWKAWWKTDQKRVMERYGGHNEQPMKDHEAIPNTIEAIEQTLKPGETYLSFLKPRRQIPLITKDGYCSGGGFPFLKGTNSILRYSGVRTYGSSIVLFVEKGSDAHTMVYDSLCKPTTSPLTDANVEASRELVGIPLLAEDGLPNLGIGPNPCPKDLEQKRLEFMSRNFVSDAGSDLPWILAKKLALVGTLPDREKRAMFERLRLHVTNEPYHRCRRLQALTKLALPEADRFIDQELTKKACPSWEEVRSATAGSQEQKSYFERFRQEYGTWDTLFELANDERLFPAGLGFLNDFGRKTIFLPDELKLIGFDDQFVLYEDEALSKVKKTYPPLLYTRCGSGDCSSYKEPVRLLALGKGSLQIRYKSTDGWVARNSVAFPSVIVVDSNGGYLTDLFFEFTFEKYDAVTPSLQNIEGQPRLILEFGSQSEDKRWLQLGLVGNPPNQVNSVSWYRGQRQSGTTVSTIFSPEVRKHLTKTVGLGKVPLAQREGITERDSMFFTKLSSKTPAIRVGDYVYIVYRP